MWPRCSGGVTPGWGASNATVPSMIAPFVRRVGVSRVQAIGIMRARSSRLFSPYFNFNTLACPTTSELMAPSCVWAAIRTGPEVVRHEANGTASRPFHSNVCRSLSHRLAALKQGSVYVFERYRRSQVARRVELTGGQLDLCFAKITYA